MCPSNKVVGNKKSHIGDYWLFLSSNQSVVMVLQHFQVTSVQKTHLSISNGVDVQD